MKITLTFECSSIADLAFALRNLNGNQFPEHAQPSSQGRYTDYTSPVMCSDVQNDSDSQQRTSRNFSYDRNLTASEIKSQASNKTQQ